MGGFIVASRVFIDWLINTAGAFIYTTALPPAACVAAMAALDIVAREPQRREKVLRLAERLRVELACRDLVIGDTGSQIIPVMAGTPEAAVELSAQLQADGLLVPAIRPPAVPRGTARLRISLSADHDDADLDRLIRSLERHYRSVGQPRR
jgi:7-keto-8-aminopelargonate synthetase-like enzyme